MEAGRAWRNLETESSFPRNKTRAFIIRVLCLEGPVIKRKFPQKRQCSESIVMGHSLEMPIVSHAVIGT